MKSIDLLCASPASIATCSSIDQHNPIIKLGGRAIDRHNPHLRDTRRSKPIVPSSTPQPPLPPPNSKSFHQNSRKKKKKTSSGSPSVAKQIQQQNIFSPPGSSRCLLSDTDKIFDVVPEFNPRKALVSVKPTPTWFDNSRALVASSSSNMPPDQVVVLRVSLHCKACEGKVRKHISRMQGVTSFMIDFQAKKVTVIGDVTPLGVLSSVSKVKAAQFWSSSQTPPSFSSTF
ncbi:hypothetical protein GIB67_037513 [Kingdonia uniflora]|uniref:HMA domain-containing protein n=1 Tax=Kingdonia uniflora TaxID=39325 RepID=A0A7J7NB24_9MAGN|nr:hypothetical protein GIB67_037513 [Kingdonia uniflora]